MSRPTPKVLHRPALTRAPLEQQPDQTLASTNLPQHWPPNLPQPAQSCPHTRLNWPKCPDPPPTCHQRQLCLPLSFKPVAGTNTSSRSSSQPDLPLTCPQPALEPRTCAGAARPLGATTRAAGRSGDWHQRRSTRGGEPGS
eukprot:scaffold6413_cov121-Isochrysis_galbana.AAC.1